MAGRRATTFIIHKTETLKRWFSKI
jgi:hypothetical protein